MTARTFGWLAALLGASLLAETACADGIRATTPACLAGVCVGERAPTEKALKQRFGGQSFDLGFRTRGYCYEVSGPENRAAHLLFGLKNFGDGWRVVSVRASERPICTAATPLKRAVDLKTGEGLTSALQYVPVDPSLALSALFVVADDRVVAIEVSSDV